MNHRVGKLVGMIGLWAANGLVFAEVSPDGTMPDELAMLFDDIPAVYTASKFEQRLTDAPASVSVVTAEDIRRYGYRTLGEILRSLRSLVTTYDRNYGYLGGRGFALPGDFNGRFLFMVDGVRVNDPVYGGGLIDTASIVDVDLIERIEFVRGPASSLYGAEAMFGVLNIVTKRGRDFDGMQVSTTAGALDTRGTRLTWGRRSPDGPEILLSGTSYRSSGQKSLYFGEFDDPGAGSDGLATDRDGDRSENFLARFGQGEFTFEAGWVSRRKAIPTGSYGTVFNHPDNRTRDRQALAGLTWRHGMADGTHLTGRFYYNRSDYDATYVFDWAAEGAPPHPVPNIDYSRSQRAGAEFFADHRLGERHRLTLGAEYRADYQLDQVNYDEEVYLDDRRSATAWAAYLQDEIRLDERLLVNLGLRYDHFQTFGDTVNPRLGLVSRLAPATWLKCLYGTGFRAPTPYELYYNDGGITYIPALDLSPETIQTTELVLEHLFRPQLLGTLALFTYDHERLITIGSDPATGKYVFRNADEAVRVSGAEAELEGPLAVGWRGRFSYSYTNTDAFRSLSVTSYAPNHVAKANLTAPLGGQWFAGLELLHTGRRPTLDGGSLPPVTLTNLTISGSGWVRDLEFSASVYNLFDRSYADPVSEEFVQRAIEQDGRTYRVKLGYRF